MKKRVIVFVIIMCVAATLIGCSRNRISDDVVSIVNYKRLEIPSSQIEVGSLSSNEYEEMIWETLLKNCEIKEYPEELQSLIDELEKQYSYVTYYDNQTPAERIESLHGMTVEELAKKQLKKKYAVALIAREEGLALTEADYEAELEKRAEKSGVCSVEYENMFGAEELYHEFHAERVLECLKKYMK